MKPCAQVYGQAWANMPAKIVGTREGLEELYLAIGAVLADEKPTNVTLAAFDGETYSLRVEMVETATPMHYTCLTAKG